MHGVKCLTLVIWRGQGTCDRDVPAVINIKQPLTSETTELRRHTAGGEPFAQRKRRDAEKKKRNANNVAPLQTRSRLKEWEKL